MAQGTDTVHSGAWEDEVWSLFAEEGGEALDLMEEALLKLESDPRDAGEVARLFRAVHTFKGQARMMGLSLIESLAHDAEEVAALVRDEGVCLTPEMVDLLLEVLDRLRQMLDHAVVHRSDVDLSPAQLQARLRALLQGGPAGGSL